VKSMTTKVRRRQRPPNKREMRWLLEYLRPFVPMEKWSVVGILRWQIWATVWTPREKRAISAAFDIAVEAFDDKAEGGGA